LNSGLVFFNSSRCGLKPVSRHVHPGGDPLSRARQEKARENKVPPFMETVQVHHSHHGPSLLRLFASFLRMGITAFGGPAMMAYLRKMAVGQKQWLDGESFQDGVALCQTIPGATVMQMAAYIGLKARGVRFRHSPFRNVFKGSEPCGLFDSRCAGPAPSWRRRWC
jgi:hypothetical protein